MAVHRHALLPARARTPHLRHFHRVKGWVDRTATQRGPRRRKWPRCQGAMLCGVPPLSGALVKPLLYKDGDELADQGLRRCGLRLCHPLTLLQRTPAIQTT
jgi:hypothetical protein